MGHDVGYAELIDEGDETVEDIVLHVSVNLRGLEVLDYRIALDETGSGGTLSVGGLVVDHGVRLEFAIVSGPAEAPTGSVHRSLEAEPCFVQQARCSLSRSPRQSPGPVPFRGRSPRPGA